LGVVDLFILFLISFVVSVACAFVAAKLALRKGRDPVMWAVLGFLIPIIAVAVIAVLPPSDREPIG
jgi:heme/copper-type cytochrome/quinol oxidase subunit 2